jgi:hypothetical protein
MSGWSTGKGSTAWENQGRLYKEEEVSFPLVFGETHFGTEDQEGHFSELSLCKDAVVERTWYIWATR